MTKKEKTKKVNNYEVSAIIEVLATSEEDAKNKVSETLKKVCRDYDYCLNNVECLKNKEDKNEDEEKELSEPPFYY
ncbi:MAG: hypothetical protein LBQ13_00590 [Endomicrobium sp.]|jgi:hypothetical protein|nr:hypothetical protein [Endomicrobium sp.]